MWRGGAGSVGAGSVAGRSASRPFSAAMPKGSDTDWPAATGMPQAGHASTSAGNIAPQFAQ